MGLTVEEKKERSEYLDKHLKVVSCNDQKPYMFVSYSSSDWESVFRYILVPLQNNCGLNVFIDSKFDESNDDWVKQMKKNIKHYNCKGVLMFVSQTYIESHACLLEILNAISFHKQIIPIYIDNCGLKTLKYSPDTSEYDIKPHIQSAYAEVISFLNGKQSTAIEEAANSAIRELTDSINDSKLTEYDISAAFKTILENGKFNDNQLTSNPDESELKKIKAKIADVDKELVSDEKRSSSQTAAAETDKSSANMTDQPPVSTGSDTKTRAFSSTGDIAYSIYGKEYTDNQANMMLNVFAKMLKNHPDKVAEILKNPEHPLIRCASAVNYENHDNWTDDMPTCFKQGCYFDIAQGIYIGTSFNFKEKCRNIAQLLTICGEDYSVLRSDSIELPKVEIKQNPGFANKKSGDEEYSIYGKQYCGNQSQMMIDVMQFLMEKHFDKHEQLAGLLCIKLAPLGDLSDITYFRSGKELSFHGVTYSIGCSFGRNDKIKQIKKAIDICGENADEFQIDGLDEIRVASKASRSTGRRNFLND